MSKRITPVLLKNSISAIYSAIEIHNKPRISFRYETVTLLIVNAWELILKAYINKYHRSYKLIDSDGRYKTITKILAYLKTKIPENDFLYIYDNLDKILVYRNKIQHYYIEGLDAVIFTLIASSIGNYEKFVSTYFAKSIVSKDDDLVLLPIGFKRPFKPFDFLSNKSFIQDIPIPVKDFFEGFFISQRELNEKNIDGEFAIDFKYYLQSVSKGDADEVIGVDNTLLNKPIFTIQKNKNITISDNSSLPKYQLSEEDILVNFPVEYKDIQGFAKKEGLNMSKINSLLKKIKENPNLSHKRALHINNPKSQVTWRYRDIVLEMLKKCKK